MSSLQQADYMYAALSCHVVINRSSMRSQWYTFYSLYAVADLPAEFNLSVADLSLQMC